MTVIVRFAPSPTGRMHIGNARTAVLNWLFARKHEGRFILRFDDTDRERSREEFVTAIAADLGWLGIVPDETHRQSERLDVYRAAAARLKATGRLYPCYESEDELEQKRRRQRALKLPPVYDRAGLALTSAERGRLEAEGRHPYWRFKLTQQPVAWNDLVRGSQTVDTASLSDPVLVRADGTFLYTLTSVADDIAMGVSHVIRGEDHVVNTAVQIEIFEALGAKAPAFAHHSLLVGAGGEALSKRLGALSIEALRAEGFEAMAVVSVAARIGTSQAIAPARDMAELVAEFDLVRLSRAPARFDKAEIASLNARLLHGLEFADVADRLAAIDKRVTPELWVAVRGNLEKLADAATWAEVACGRITLAASPEEAPFLELAARCLPPEPWGAETWGAWTAALRRQSGRKGRDLYRPLRLALTGREEGPEMAALLPLIGRARTISRLVPGQESP